MKHYGKLGALLMAAMFGLSATTALAQSNSFQRQQHWRTAIYEAELAARHNAKLRQGRQVGKEIWKHKTEAERAKFDKRMSAIKVQKGPPPVTALHEHAKP